MSKYLVTGAAGFIGARVCQLLLHQDQQVVALDHLGEGGDLTLKTWRLSQMEGSPGFHFVQLDIRRRRDLAEVFRDHPDLEGVINLAARAGVRSSLKWPRAYFETNLMGTLNLLDECGSRSIPKFVQASSSSVYGEIRADTLHEELPVGRPLSPYAASKQAAEALCYTYHRQYEIDLSVLRFFTVYGPAGRPDMSPFRFVQWICAGRPVTVYGDGSQARDFTYVDDIARGTMLSLKRVGFEIINLGSDQPVILLEAIRLIESLSGRTAKLRFEPRHPADVDRTHADIAKASRLLDWRPEWSFQRGIEALIRWYRENESWASQIETTD